MPFFTDKKPWTHASFKSFFRWARKYGIAAGSSDVELESNDTGNVATWKSAEGVQLLSMDGVGNVDFDTGENLTNTEWRFKNTWTGAGSQTSWVEVWAENQNGFRGCSAGGTPQFNMGFDSNAGASGWGYGTSSKAEMVNSSQQIYIGTSTDKKFYAQETVSSSSATRISQVITRRYASSVSLQEWQDESDVVLAKVDSTGKGTFAEVICDSDLTVSGGGITLGGTGRIQGVDTVTSVTDAANKSYVDAQSYITAPNAPASVTTTIVGDTVDVTFAASTTSAIDAYLVYSSIDGSDYALISLIPPDDFSASMSVIDNAFTETGTQAYRVYAMKKGVLSSATTGSVAYAVSSAEPTTMSVIDLNNAFYVQWNPPSSNGRFVTAYNVYKDENAVQANLLRSNATLVYSGLNTNFMNQISGTNNNNFHQFWVETTIA